MNFDQAQLEMQEGKFIKVPEWSGYWFMPAASLGDTTIKVRLSTGEVLDSPFIENYGKRTDWEITEGFGFDAAIKALKAGKKVARSGWNGKGMYLWLQAGSTISANSCRNQHLKEIAADAHNSKVTLCDHIDMKAADGTIVIGWLASQTDMLANDWEILD